MSLSEIWIPREKRYSDDCVDLINVTKHLKIETLNDASASEEGSWRT